LLITNLFAEAAYGQNALQQIDPPGQLAGLARGPADQVGQKHQNDDANGGIDDGVVVVPGSVPVEGKRQTNQRLDNRQKIGVTGTTEPGGNGHRNDVGDGKDDVRRH